MKVRTDIIGTYHTTGTEHRWMWVEDMAGKKLPPWLDKKKKSGKGGMPMKGKMPMKGGSKSC